MLGGVILVLRLSVYPGAGRFLHRTAAAKSMFTSSTYATDTRTPKLAVNQLSLPIPDLTLPLDVILKNSWVKELQDFLQTLPTKKVSLVSSNYLFQEDLINWLVSAMIKTNPPLSNILVLSLDDTIHELMKSRGISSVCVEPQTVMVPFDPKSEMGKMQPCTFLFATRLTVVRLINYWGYDVVHYDTDAIVLKNPEPLFEKYRSSDIVGSVGRHPFALGDEWGFTLCMGFIMFRSTQETGTTCKVYNYSLCELAL